MRASIMRQPSVSPSKRMAILPFRMTLAKSDSALRRTVPWSVAKTTWRLVPFVLIAVYGHHRGDAGAGLRSAGG